MKILRIILLTAALVIEISAVIILLKDLHTHSSPVLGTTLLIIGLVFITIVRQKRKKDK